MVKTALFIHKKIKAFCGKRLGREIENGKNSSLYERDLGEK